MSEKSCVSCKYGMLLFDQEPCAACLSIIRKNGPMWDKWEPREVAKDSDGRVCDMARAMIERCQAKHGNPCDCLRVMCADWVSASCPARVFLAEHDQADAWETQS
jgi:hypothetical protein